MNIIIDLDGTILRSHRRLYVLFQNIVEKSELSCKEYWRLKRSKKTHSNILAEYFAYTNDEIIQFDKEWMSKIETPDMLELDKPAPLIYRSLSKLKECHDLHLCTSRQDRVLALRQLEKLNLREYFASVLVTEQKRDKGELLRQISCLSSKDWIVSDTGVDLQVGRDLGINSCAVYSGFLNKSILKEYKPDLLVRNFSVYTAFISSMKT